MYIGILVASFYNVSDRNIHKIESRKSVWTGTLRPIELDKKNHLVIFSNTTRIISLCLSKMVRHILGLSYSILLTNLIIYNITQMIINVLLVIITMVLTVRSVPQVRMLYDNLIILTLYYIYFKTATRKILIFYCWT